jgi:hypothetical protein
VACIFDCNAAYSIMFSAFAFAHLLAAIIIQINAHYCLLVLIKACTRIENIVVSNERGFV